MDGVSGSSSAEAPALADILTRAEAIRPLLAARMAQTEAEGRVSPEATALLSNAGLYRICQPRRFGGFEFGPSAMFELGFELGRGCGSTSWCAMVSTVNAWMVSFWPLVAQQEIWGSNPDSIVIGVFAPTGVSERVEGGYSVHGKWAFASNCDNSQWIAVGALLPAQEGKAPEVGWFMIPVGEFEIDHQSWQVIGMQGTGSKTITIKNGVFVPERMMIRLSDILKGTTPGAGIPDNPMARFSFATFGSAGLVAPLLGMAQGALDWFSETMRTKQRASLQAGSAGVASQNVHNQIRIGAASAAIDAAKEMLGATLRRSEAKVFRGETLSVAERLRVRRDIVFAAQQATDSVNMLFEGAGAASTRSDSVIQSFWRNVNSGARHATLDVRAVYGLYGEERFGMQPAGQF